MLMLRYTVLRLATLLACVAVFFAAGLRGFPLFIAAFLVSGIISFVAFKSQRDAMNRAIIERQEERIRRKTGLAPDPRMNADASGVEAAGDPDDPEPAR